MKTLKSKEVIKATSKVMVTSGGEEGDRIGGTHADSFNDVANILANLGRSLHVFILLLLCFII